MKVLVLSAARLALVLALLATVGTPPSPAQAQRTGASLQEAGSAPSQADEEQLTPDEQQRLSQLTAVARQLADTLDKYNAFASNSGTGYAVGRLNEYQQGLLNLARGIDEFGNKLPKWKLKRLINALGADKSGQLLKAQQRAAELSRQLSKVPRNLGTIMTLLDPGSKVLGALSAGSPETAVFHLVSGGCKIAVTGAAGAIGGAAGALFAPVLGPVPSITFGTAAAMGADHLYEKHVTPLFDAMAEALKNRKTADKLDVDRLMEAYGDISSIRGTFRDILALYMNLEISEAEFKAYADQIRTEIGKRNAELLKKRELDRSRVLQGLRRLENEHPEVKAAIDAFAAGTLDQKGQIRFLRDLQALYRPACRDKLAREVMRDWLAGLNHEKILKVMESARLKPPRAFYQCLCRNYSIAGTGVSYHPAPGGDCKNTKPCKGGNWGCVAHEFPRSSAAWEKCLAEHRLQVEKDEKGRIVDPGIRIDEYFAGQKVIREIKRGG